MPHHDWGDESFDWPALNDAMEYISKMYHRIYKRYPLMKEKYGTIRFEMIGLWVTTEDELITLCKIVTRACKKYDHIAAEISSDLYQELEDYPTNKELYAYKHLFGNYIFLYSLNQITEELDKL